MKDTFDYIIFKEKNYPLLNHLYNKLNVKQRKRIKFDDFCAWVRKYSD